MIYDIFQTQSTLTPTSPAIVTSQLQSFTYAEAQEKINQWANYFIKQGIGANDRVAVLLDNEDNHPFIFLALDRINATYVPFDRDIPKLQLEQDIQTLGLKAFVTDEGACKQFDIDASLELTPSDDDISKEATVEPNVLYNKNGFEKTSYIVSSSGSSGRKKWIPILGAGLSYWAKTLPELFTDPPIQHMLATRSPAYDARIFEYVCAFSQGGAIHLLDQYQRKDFPSILNACETAPIDGLICIASQFGHAQIEKVIPRLKNAGVKHLLVTGDACTVPLKNACEQYELNLWNCYGPTEATFGLSHLKVNGLPLLGENHTVPIGLPFGDDIHIHIIDGILWIESPYLTPGYLNAEDNQNAFTYTKDKVPHRLFRTGDAFSMDGPYLRFKGRTGFEKIDGVKVSTLDIKQRFHDYLALHSDESFDIEVVMKPHLGTTKPVAYLANITNLNQTTLLTYLNTTLSKEAFPVLIQLETLPHMSSSQKVDQQALIAREDLPREFLLNGSESQSSSPMAEAIEKLWGELFNLEHIDPFLEFIYLGGDSIKAVALADKIRETLDPTFDYISLLRLPSVTINSIAHYLTDKKILCTQQALIKPLNRPNGSKKNLFFLPTILGEGHFSYRHLADNMPQRLDHQFYGLSDPGIVDINASPKNMADAVELYISAIKSIQPEGPYELFGFSFGATLAYEVARVLQERGEKIAELYLVDGLPPYVYQHLSNADFTTMLEAWVNLTVKNLYQETIPPISYTDLSSLSKQEQVERVFSSIETHCVHQASKNLLHVAQQHLKMILNFPLPSKKLETIYPVLYRCDSKINQLDSTQTSRFDRQYQFWNRYFSTLGKCDELFYGEHLDMLKPSDPQRFGWDNPSMFWTFAGFPAVKPKEDAEKERPFYRITENEEHTAQLMVFFLPKSEQYEQLLNTLKKMGLQPYIVSYDKYFQTVANKNAFSKGRINPTLASQSSIICDIPPAQRNEVENVMATQRIQEKPSKNLTEPMPHFLEEIFKKGGSRGEYTSTGKYLTGDVTINFYTTVGDKLLQVYIPYHGDPEKIGLKLRLSRLLPPGVTIMTPSDGIAFSCSYQFDKEASPTINELNELLANFIQVIHEFMDEEPPLSNDLNVRPT